MSSCRLRVHIEGSHQDHGGNVAAVDEDGPRVDVVQPQQQPQQRRLRCERCVIRAQLWPWQASVMAPMTTTFCARLTKENLLEH